MDIEAIRLRYLPDRVRLLLVGESPPASGDFFYVDSAMTRHTARAFQEARDLHFPSVTAFLRHFKDCGCYLDDLSVAPVNHLEARDRNTMLWLAVDSLAERIRMMNPQIVAIALMRIERPVREAIFRSGCQPRVYVLPFAGFGNQGRYVKELATIITEHL